jgi:hypothetical protein
MLYEIQQLTENYFKWLKDKTILKQTQEWVEITTPFLDRHNDYVQIYIKKEGEQFILTDDGYTLSDLRQSGCLLETPKRKQILQTMLNGFGVLKKEEDLVIYATAETFNLKKHNLIQAILAINDLFYLATPSIENLFLEDVTKWLDDNDIRYTPQIKLTGDSQYDHLFHFVIPKSRKAPERIMRAVSNPSRDSAESFLLAWQDTKSTRNIESTAIAILNDKEHKISPSVITAMSNYDIIGVPWKERDKHLEKLAA